MCWGSNPGLARQALLPTELYPRPLPLRFCVVKHARVQVPLPTFAFSRAKTEHLICSSPFVLNWLASQLTGPTVSAVLELQA